MIVFVQDSQAMWIVTRSGRTISPRFQTQREARRFYVRHKFLA